MSDHPRVLSYSQYVRAVLVRADDLPFLDYIASALPGSFISPNLWSLHLLNQEEPIAGLPDLADIRALESLLKPCLTKLFIVGIAAVRELLPQLGALCPSITFFLLNCPHVGRRDSEGLTLRGNIYKVITG
jgi:hypothetical protein